jgi:hypothetical protein
LFLCHAMSLYVLFELNNLNSLCGSKRFMVSNRRHLAQTIHRTRKKHHTLQTEEQASE